MRPLAGGARQARRNRLRLLLTLVLFACAYAFLAFLSGPRRQTGGQVLPVPASSERSVHAASDSVASADERLAAQPPLLSEASADERLPAQTPPLPVAAQPPLLSRRTAAWDALLAQGLHHRSADYPRIVPGPGQEEEWEFWQDRVMYEYPDGCRRGHGENATRKQCLPKLIIIGQFKAGTTALFDMLAQHPSVLLPYREPWMRWHETCPLNKPGCVLKEVNGFSRIGERQRWSERSLLSRYHVLPFQALDDERPVLEASPYYLSGMVDALEDLTRFVRYIPGVKVIALVRNPVDRAFSEYLMFSEPPFRGNSTGCGRGPSAARFEELAVEELRVASSALLEDEAMAHRCLVESTKWQHVPLVAGRNNFRGRLLRWGEYSRYLSVWMRMLGPDQLTVVRNEDMDAQPQRLLAELQAWAGLPYAPLQSLHTNLAGCRGSIARGAWDAKKKAQADSGGCDGAGAWAVQKRMDPGAVAALRQHFRPHNALLAQLTGQDFRDWDAGSAQVYLGAAGEGGDGVDWEQRLAHAAAEGGRLSGAVSRQKAAHGDAAAAAQ